MRSQEEMGKIRVLRVVVDPGSEDSRHVDTMIYEEIQPVDLGQAATPKLCCFIGPDYSLEVVEEER